MSASIERQRIDKWLWYARVVKTRSLAQKLVTSGKVRLDRERVTSSSIKVREGQVLTITLQQQVKVLKVVGFSGNRGPYSLACLLYDDLTPADTQMASMRSKQTKNKIETIHGKPTKRERKAAVELKRSVQRDA